MGCYRRWNAIQLNFSDLEEENLREGNEIAEIFRIETDIFDFETPLCKEFKEFNHHLKIDILMCSLKIYQDLRHMIITKIHSTMNGIMKCHGLMINHGWKIEFGRNLLMIYVMNARRLVSKVDMLNGPLVTREKMDILEECWWGKKEEKESSEDAWSNYLPNDEYVVPTGRVVVPTGRYVVSAGKVIIIVSPGRLSLVPTSRVLSPGRVK
ncbi:hypothetical protein Tco_0695632 [Tanacetum coccineum]